MENVSNWIISLTMGGKFSIFVFAIFAIGLLFASIKLVRYADIIIAKTKFGGAFIGGAFIAGITSFPEMITEISQSAIGNPGAGISDDLGSNAFSALLIAVAALLFYKIKIFDKVDRWTKISMFLSAGLAFIIMIFLLIGQDVQIGKPGTFVIGLIPMAFFAFYIYSLRLTYKYGDTSEYNHNLSTKDNKLSVKSSIWLFIFWGLLIVSLSLCLNWSASAMMIGYNISSRSVGGTFLAIITSLPEIIAFFALLKKKQSMAAIAALIGSHMFNVGMQFFGDMAYKDDSIYNVPEVQDVWIIALMTGAMMIVTAIYALFSKRVNKNWIRLLIPSFVISIYFAGWLFMFLY